jgi:cytoskeletal protein CcmA (bactofilin family)
MREERGQLNGNQIIAERYTLWGSIGGDVRVVEGGKFYLRGSIYGNLTVESGGRAHIFGNLQGNLIVKRGAKVIHSGVVGRNVVNSGGRLHIEMIARVHGDIKTKSGDTTVEQPEPRTRS